MNQEVAGIGHNNPPSDAQMLVEYLRERNGEMLARCDDLILASQRAPAEVTNDDVAGKMTDMIKLITSHTKLVEQRRVSEKEPYLTLGRSVDNFFKNFTDSMEGAKKALLMRLDPYLHKKEEERRAALKAEEERQRAEAERLAREASDYEEASLPVAAEQAINDAARAEDSANAAAKLADAKPAELSRTRGNYGGTASLKTQWVAEIVSKESLDLNALRPYLPTDALQKALNAFVRAGGRELRGAKIEQRSTAAVR